jgi:hypothetical protein
MGASRSAQNDLFIQSSIFEEPLVIGYLPALINMQFQCQPPNKTQQYV